MAGGWARLGGRSRGVGLTAGLRVSDTIARRDDASPWFMAERTVGRTLQSLGGSRAVQFSSLDAVAARRRPLARSRRGSSTWAVRQPITPTMRRVGDDVQARERTSCGGRTRTGWWAASAWSESIFPSLASTLSGTSRGVDLVIERRAASGVVRLDRLHVGAHAHRGSGEPVKLRWRLRPAAHRERVRQQRLSSRLRVSAKLRYGSNFPMVGYFKGTHAGAGAADERNQVRLPVLRAARPESAAGRSPTTAAG